MNQEKGWWNYQGSKTIVIMVKLSENYIKKTNYQIVLGKRIIGKFYEEGELLKKLYKEIELLECSTKRKQKKWKKGVIIKLYKEWKLF